MEKLEVAVLILLFFAPISTVAYHFPTLFVSVFFVAYCGFFGIMQREVMGVVTTENIIVFLSLSTLPVIALRSRNWSFEKVSMARFPVVMLLLFIAGVYLPFFRGDSSLSVAINDGKQFISYLFVLYCILFKDHIKTKKILFLVGLSALILSLEIIIYNVSGIYPPGFLPVNAGVGSGFSDAIHIMFPQVLSAALLYMTARIILQRKKNLSLLILPILVLGLIFQGHFSIMIVTLLTLGVFALGLQDFIYKRIKLFILLVSLTSIIFWVYTFFSSDFSALYSDEIYQGLISRANISAQRIEYITKNLAFGYGFIGEDSKIGQQFSLSSVGLHDRRLSTVDGGYVDLIVRFGFFGTLLVLWSFYKFLISLSKSSSIDAQVLIVFLVFYFPIMITWSVLTYIHGIVFLGILIIISRNFEVFGGQGSVKLKRYF